MKQCACTLNYLWCSLLLLLFVWLGFVCLLCFVPGLFVCLFECRKVGLVPAIAEST